MSGNLAGSESFLDRKDDVALSAYLPVILRESFPDRKDDRRISVVGINTEEMLRLPRASTEGLAMTRRKSRSS
jgi:hypothetical protein